MKSSTGAAPERPPTRQPAHTHRAPAMTHEFESLRPALAYLSPDEISQIEQAYEFSRSAHEGQFRKSGEPYISHPLAVAGILAGWHLDAQTLMRRAAARRGGGHSGHGKRNRGALRQAGRAAGRRRVQARQAGVCIRAARAGGELPQDAAGDGARRAGHPDQAGRPPAQHAHHGRRCRPTSASASPGKRWKSTRRSPTGWGCIRVYHELEDLGFRYSHPMRYQVLAKAVKAARGNRRELVDKIKIALQAKLERCKIEATITGREKHLYSHLPQDAGEEPVVLRGVRHLRLSRGGAATSRTATWRSARCTRCTSRCPASSRTTSRSRRPTATSRCTTIADRPLRHAGRDPDPHRRHAPAGRSRASPRTGCTRCADAALERGADDAPITGCSRCSRSRPTRAIRPNSSNTSRSTCSPTRSTCSRPRARSWRCRAAPRRWISPTRCTPTSATTASRRKSITS